MTLAIYPIDRIDVSRDHNTQRTVDRVSLALQVRWCVLWTRGVWGGAGSRAVGRTRLGAQMLHCQHPAWRWSIFVTCMVQKRLKRMVVVVVLLVVVTSWDWTKDAVVEEYCWTVRLAPLLCIHDLRDYYGV
ncbi:uncharacterized protein EI97DRAFT_238611 [Westerdykella ornata]|uniref:Uncharacterized protein n=1 Tax=Westerdykella ornata TaxID=318751 RepID=A0A6A6J6C0_WESOR|nr:uncharacterized protein EI97DRAFT_238611 [Westerdykella ornata]KAF2271975.1 hypothetical protein EI97DRAFT_238611 [Westerdykella ornata]